jgi:hypothetical protein
MQTAAQAANLALSSRSSRTLPTESSEKPLKPSQSLLDQFWVRMGALFGHTWASQYGTAPDGVAADTWATALSGVTPAQIARGMRETLALGNDFPPSAPRFRALCFGVPSLATVALEITRRERSPFTRLVWANLDSYLFTHADQRTSERLLKDAYGLAREHVMRGGALPEAPVAEVAHTPEVLKPADPGKVAGYVAELEALLGTNVPCGTSGKV